MIPARRLPFAANLPFHRLAAIAMVLAATLPVGLLGFLVYDRVEQSLALDAVVRTDRAVDAANAEVSRAAQSLDDLVRSYAQWTTFATQAEAGDLDGIRSDVLAFLVERGSITGGIVVTGAGTATAGPAELTTALAEESGPLVQDPRLLTVDGHVYLVDDDRIEGAGGRDLGRIAFARALGARFAADVAGFTGFAVAVVGADGSVTVTTDASVTGAAVAAADASDRVIRTGDVISRRFALGPGAGGERLVLATRVSALQAAAGTLPLLVLALLAFTAIVAALLAVLLSAILRRRLGVVHDGLIAVADGRVPPSATTGGGDDIARLSAGLDRLVRTLDRREVTLRRCLEATATIPINTSPREAANRLAGATTEIFGVAWCRLVAADGTMLGWAGSAAMVRPDDHPGPAVPPARATATMGLGRDDRILETGSPSDGAWTDGDQALLEVMALLAGSVLDEVAAYGQAAGRAARLDRLNRLQREFLRSVSHNLRAPLATIELAATDLEDTASSAFVRERAEAIKLEERRLARLVNQVLILSRMESGTLELDGEPVALPPLVRRIAAELGISHRVRVLDRGPGVVAFADAAAMEQIAWIILDNAARYAPSGTIRVEVIPERPEPDATIVLAVEDEGPGVSPDERRRIFQRFARGRAGSTTDGTGIGLSVARGLARTLGGDITCRAGEMGARFEVRLPAGGGDDDPDIGEVPARVAGQSPRDGARAAAAGAPERRSARVPR